MNNIQWHKTGHKMRKFELFISSDGKYFKKQTNRLHSRLLAEYNALKIVKEVNLPQFQVFIDGDITDDISYIISEYCGVSLTRGKVPANYIDQLDIIQQGLDTLIAEHKVYHNDVLVRNVLVNNDILTLMDFEMATIGGPDKRSTKRPMFNTVQPIIDKIRRWGIR